METRTQLHKLRKDSRRTIYEIIERARAAEPSFPRTHVGYLCIERRGTQNIAYLRALAAALDTDLSIVEQAALPIKKVPESVSN
jgi:hypothetical protein